MIKRDLFKKLGISPSIFGIGTMRLPINSSKEGPFSADINLKDAKDMIRYAIDNGVTYVDTAYPYHAKESEKLVGEALKDGYREKVTLTTKLPTFLLKEKKDMEKILDEQLLKLKTDTIDFYLLHTLSVPLWDLCKKLEALEFLDRMKEKGKIRFAGFSFHDEYYLFEEIINSYNWDMCQIQLNYMDYNYQAGVKGLQLAGKKNIPVVIMEPLKGGQLAKKIEDIKKLWEDEGFEYDPVKISFRWLVSHKEVAVILSGVHDMKQTKNNIDIFNNIDLSPLTQKEEELYEKTRKILQERTKISCTSCGYCMPCPSGVKIPDIFDKYNSAYIFEDLPAYKIMYNTMHIAKNSDASRCVACKKCEKACPQHLPIINTLKEAHNILTKN